MSDKASYIITVSEFEKLQAELSELRIKCADYEKALQFYAAEESMSCRLRYKYEDTPRCLQGDTDYFQDPADLPILQDGGKRAKEVLAKHKTKPNEET